LVCDRFANMSTRDAAAILIHEVLHVAGQPEDQTQTAGPNDPPTTNQIQQRVKEACNL
jgi:predicted metallopeptidase